MKEYKESIYPLLKELCAIPAPSHHEEERAEFCRNYFVKSGFDKVYTDGAKNVICEYCCEGSDEITVFAAHTDTVFPDTEPMPFYEEGNKAFCPGIGDDSASVATLLTAAKYIKDNDIKPSKGMLFVCNSCEEGLGNLKGVRALMEAYKGRIARFITIDAGNLQEITDRCVGSHRYSVVAETEGGHSYGKFGNENAIKCLSKIIAEIYNITVPFKENTKTTYNVGTISGGTSVNTIAQRAEMLCEYRSDDVECLDIMKNRFEQIFENAKNDKVKITVTKVGDRPCSRDVDPYKLSCLTDICKDVMEKHTGLSVYHDSGSTDCNIPMSMGIPAVAVGSYIGGGAHTRGEWLYIDSLPKGFEIIIDLMMRFI